MSAAIKSANGAVKGRRSSPSGRGGVRAFIHSRHERKTQSTLKRPPSERRESRLYHHALGLGLKYTRVIAGIAPEEFAARTGISLDHLYALEYGDGFESLYAMTIFDSADAMGVLPPEFIRNVEQRMRK